MTRMVGWVHTPERTEQVGTGEERRTVVHPEHYCRDLGGIREGHRAPSSGWARFLGITIWVERMPTGEWSVYNPGHAPTIGETPEAAVRAHLQILQARYTWCVAFADKLIAEIVARGNDTDPTLPAPWSYTPAETKPDSGGLPGTYRPAAYRRWFGIDYRDVNLRRWEEEGRPSVACSIEVSALTQPSGETARWHARALGYTDALGLAGETPTQALRYLAQAIREESTWEIEAVRGLQAELAESCSGE